MGYLPICYSNQGLRLPEMNWQCSVSVDMFNFEDTAPYKVFWQHEPPEIVDNIDKLIKNAKFYDLILTWHQRVLSECGNAKFFPMGSVWTPESDMSHKKFAASFITSSKTMCWGHQYRQDIYNLLPEAVRELKITKHRSPPWLPNKLGLLEPFQFHIVMENAMHNNFFSEKVNDAFATKTFPLYYGCPNLADFYNPDGFMKWDSPRDLTDILKGLRPEFYESRRAAIEENYERAQKYVDRTGNLVKAITDSWTPKIDEWEGGPNVMRGGGL